jgi:hypothetical protein
MFPSHYQIHYEHLRQHLDEAHTAWWKEWKAQQPDFVIENIRFEHDPNWNKRFLSIQSAHDGNHLIWKATKVVASMFGTAV